MSEAAVARAQLVALRTAAALPPLPLAVVHLADTVLRDVVSEVVEQCMHESAKTLPCDASISSLLEGAAETLPDAGARISTALHRLLSEEISQTARAAKRSREALEPSIAAGTGADIFGPPISLSTFDPTPQEYGYYVGGLIREVALLAAETARLAFARNIFYAS